MTVRILVGDCRSRLRELPDESVQCVVTSPPYFGLRDYGCDGQIGLEASPDAFVAEMVAVFREVRRVLKSDGVAWLNLGDSYAGGGGYAPNAPSSQTSKSGRYGALGALRTGGVRPGNPDKNGGVSNRDGLGPVAGAKAKDLIGIPWAVAFAIRADGWWLRQDIIWSKPNPMPESVTDRCTKAHEYLFLLSKSERYYFDADAIAEPAIWSADARAGEGRLTYDGKRQGAKGTGQEAFVAIKDTRNRRSVWTVPTHSFNEAHFATFPPALIEPCVLAGCPEGGTVLDPFGGAGTTGLVADRLKRNAILIELNPAYADMAERRIKNDAGLLAQVHQEAVA